MSQSVSSKIVGKSSPSLMDFDELSKIIAAARAERAEFIAGHLVSLFRSWNISRSQYRFNRVSALIAAARERRSDFLSSLLPTWLHLGPNKRSRTGGPKYS